jgi:hypothetical protein
MNAELFSKIYMIIGTEAAVSENKMLKIVMKHLDKIINNKTKEEIILSFRENYNLDEIESEKLFLELEHGIFTGKRDYYDYQLIRNYSNRGMIYKLRR